MCCIETSGIYSSCFHYACVYGIIQIGTYLIAKQAYIYMPLNTKGSRIYVNDLKK